jgi:hypothetical protein
VPVQGPLKTVERELAKLKPYERNARRHPPEQIEALRASVRALGIYRPILLREDLTIGAGHGLCEAAVAEGIEKGPTIVLKGLTDAEWKQLVLIDNRLAEGSSWDEELLALELGDLKLAGVDMSGFGFDDTGLSSLGAFDGLPGGSSGSGAGGAGQASGALAERFGIPPFSVMNAREGWWQKRKAAWLALGIRSEVGRGDNLLKFSDTVLQPDPEKRSRKANAEPTGGGGGVWKEFNERRAERQGGEPTGTSIFDPVLCELAYRWFSPKGGLVLDPFAGGSVRGIVAAKLGRRYVGCDLRSEQTEANAVQAEQILGGEKAMCRWHAGDSRVSLGDGEGSVETGLADFIFSCPPYADLERYSDDPQDLSTMEYEEFLEAYREIIAKACARLKDDAFACFVVGDVRSPTGAYRGFVADTIKAFEAAGLFLYNEGILVTAVSTLAMRAGKQFAASRKLGKAHQNVLVFLKGSSKKAVAALGEVEFGDVANIDPDALDEDAKAELEGAPAPEAPPLKKPAAGEGDELVVEFA